MLDECHAMPFHFFLVVTVVVVGGGAAVVVVVVLLLLLVFLFSPPPLTRLLGLVVKAPASRAEGPGFESRLRRDFFRGRVVPVTSKLALQVATLPDAWRYKGQHWDWSARCQYTVTG